MVIGVITAAVGQTRHVGTAARQYATGTVTFVGTKLIPYAVNGGKAGAVSHTFGIGTAASQLVGVLFATAGAKQTA